ncbi:MAG: serine hydrolase [Dermatophilaceae bacterium]
MAPEAAPAPASQPEANEFAGSAALREQVTVLAARNMISYGVGIVDGLTGRRFVLDPSGGHQMASTIKVDLLAGLLVRAQREGRGLTSGERARAESMIRVSDNAAAQALWTANGGATGMAALWRSLGMTSTVPGSSGRWGLSTTTAEDRLRILEVLAGGSEQLSTERTGYELGLMSQVTASQRWGVGGVARAGETAHVKNGWLPRPSTTRWIVSTTGRLVGPSTDLRLAVLSHGHRGQAAGIAFVEGVLAAAREHLGV